MTYDELFKLMEDPERFQVLDRSLDGRGVELTGAWTASDEHGAYIAVSGVRYGGSVTWDDKVLGRVTVRIKAVP